jgi:pSer/pThr/pTyr-binding forkhead associated (FHA) protein
MRDQGDLSNGLGPNPLWVDGDMMFRVFGLGREPDRLVKVSRPFGLIGREGDADLRINDRNVSTHHAYLHLDSRGVYAVDLVTRTGTRLRGEPRMVGWLQPGEWLEVAGRRIELVRVRLGGVPVVARSCDDDLLADTERPDLVSVTLEPHKPNDPPWVLGSELVFLGWSGSCGIPVKDSSVSRTHCVLVRARNGAFLVNLCGRQTWIEDRAVEGASILHDGDMITLGSTQFTAHIEAPAPAQAQATSGYPALRADTALAVRLEPRPGVDLIPMPSLSLDPALIPPEAQTALIGWMMGTIQGGQGEILRRQGEFQMAITQVLQQIQQDNATLLNAHLKRIESIDHELAALRAEIERRNASPNGYPLPLPNVAPLRIARPSPTGAPSSASAAPTTWLLERVGQLENENRSAWKDLLGRLSSNRRAT